MTVGVVHELVDLAHDLSHELHVTDVWVRREGRWQIVRRHATVAD